MSAPKIFVVGAGIGGLTAAIALARQGADVTVYEQAPALAEIGAGINVQAVAIGVLDRLGVTEEILMDPVLGDGIRTSKIEYYTVDGILVADEPVGRAKGDVYPQFSTHRAKFHSALLSKVRELIGEEKVILDHVFTGMDRKDGEIRVNFEKMSRRGEKQPDAVCHFLIGADGLKSPVRSLLLGDGLPQHTGKTIYRGMCEIDAHISDGNTVVMCGNDHGVFIAYPISEKMRKDGRCHCNWGLNVRRPEPTGVESWTSLGKVEDIKKELAEMGANMFGGLTPLQIAQRSEKILSWALFDRDPLATFDFGNVTLLGDAAHPLLPYGSQGATQAIMDAEALGVAYGQAMAAGKGVEGCSKIYSDMRCGPSGKVVIANRDMGSTAVLREVETKCASMSKDEKEKWIGEHGRAFFNETIASYRASMPKSVSCLPDAKKQKTEA